LIPVESQTFFQLFMFFCLYESWPAWFAEAEPWLACSLERCQVSSISSHNTFSIFAGMKACQAALTGALMAKNSTVLAAQFFVAIAFA